MLQCDAIRSEQMFAVIFSRIELTWYPGMMTAFKLFYFSLYQNVLWCDEQVLDRQQEHHLRQGGDKQNIYRNMYSLLEKGVL